MLWAAGGLGTFAIITGIVSVVASNWLYTSDEIKLGLDLILCAAFAFAIYKVCVSVEATHERAWLREVLVIIYYGFVLASMGLIGQTYQLDGSIAKLLLVWTIATLPLVLLARGRFIAILWTVGTGTTYFMNIVELHEFATHVLRFNTDDTLTVTTSFFLLGPLLFIYLSRIPWLVQHRPMYAREISRYSWLTIVTVGFLTQYLWYVRTAGEIPMMVFPIIGAVTGLTAYLLPTLYKDSTRNTHLAMRVLLLTVFLLGFSASWHTSPMNVIGALTNLAYLCLLAWVALKIGSTLLFNFLTAFICIRILVIYFEVFGSMMQTGLGLIAAGTLTLLLTWLWFKKSANLAERLTAGEPHAGESHDA